MGISSLVVFLWAPAEVGAELKATSALAFRLRLEREETLDAAFAQDLEPVHRQNEDDKVAHDCTNVDENELRLDEFHHAWQQDVNENVPQHTHASDEATDEHYVCDGKVCSIALEGLDKPPAVVHYRVRQLAEVPCHGQPSTPDGVSDSRHGGARHRRGRPMAENHDQVVEKDEHVAPRYAVPQNVGSEVRRGNRNSHLLPQFEVFDVVASLCAEQVD
mmetsp:Transcript_30885/g.89701  ORF Transcript_30885/g.89701 Transcript_30885/m.89701 type:complete len:218 (+) Transcript_30885:60-713(+)